MTLKDVATWERGLAGKIYPAGTSTIQVSATKGQLGFLEEAGEVEAKNVAIMPDKDINPKYFYMVLQRNVEEFLAKYQTGLNIKAEEIGEFPIALHDRDTQDELVRIYEWIEAETEIVQKELENAIDEKTWFMEKLLASGQDQGGIT